MDLLYHRDRRIIGFRLCFRFRVCFCLRFCGRCCPGRGFRCGCFGRVCLRYVRFRFRGGIRFRFDIGIGRVCLRYVRFRRRSGIRGVLGLRIQACKRVLKGFVGLLLRLRTICAAGLGREHGKGIRAVHGVGHACQGIELFGYAGERFSAHKGVGHKKREIGEIRAVRQGAKRERGHFLQRALLHCRFRRTMGLDEIAESDTGKERSGDDETDEIDFFHRYTVTSEQSAFSR